MRRTRVNAAVPTVVTTALVEKVTADAPDPAAVQAHMEAFNLEPGMPEARNESADTRVHRHLERAARQRANRTPVRARALLEDPAVPRL